MEKNIRHAETLALEVWLAGYAAICPHANTRFYQGTAPDRLWLDGDLAILAKCDALLLTDNWEKSAGTRAELDYALRHFIPAFFTLDSLKEAM